MKRTDGPVHRFTNLVSLLRHRAEIQGDQTAYTFLPGDDRTQEMTYAQLDRRARALAVRLLEEAEPGDRVLLLFPSSLEYVISFFACLYANMIAVPAYPPRPRKPSPRIEGMVADADIEVALTTPDLLRTYERQFLKFPYLASMEWLAVDSSYEDRAGEWSMPEIGRDTLAFLQYTSGSTSAPKGVMVSHQNLLANEEMMWEAFGLKEGDVLASWLPFYHDMGMIGMILHNMYVGGHIVFMAPSSFLQRPARWLEMISKYKAVFSGAPNFAYDLCAEKVSREDRMKLDLSSWRVGLNGAEPVHRSTLEKFTQAFAPCGYSATTMCPGYGLAEGTLYVSCSVGEELPKVQSFDPEGLKMSMAIPSEQGKDQVLCGSYRWFDQDLRIVNPVSKEACREGQIGEIWLAGANVTQGYWQRDDINREIFGAHIADSGEGPFLRTGDLGFVYDDQVIVSGRVKDLIIIDGNNHYPQDIERTVEAAHPALRQSGSGAFAISEDGTEKLVVMVEVERDTTVNGLREKYGQAICPVDKIALEEVIKQSIREAVYENHNVAVADIALIRAMTIPKTTSGKIQRHACKQAYLQPIPA